MHVHTHAIACTCNANTSTCACNLEAEKSCDPSHAYARKQTRTHACTHRHTLADQSSRGMLFVLGDIRSILLVYEASTAANSIKGILGGLVRVRRVSVPHSIS